MPSLDCARAKRFPFPFAAFASFAARMSRSRPSFRLRKKVRLRSQTESKGRQSKRVSLLFAGLNDERQFWRQTQVGAPAGIGTGGSRGNPAIITCARAPPGAGIADNLRTVS